MTRPAWFVGVALVALPACSRPPTAEDMAGRVVGTWRLVRENGREVPVRTDVSGLVQFHPDGTVSYEAVGPAPPNDTLEKRQVKPVTGTFRFRDGETLEVTGEKDGRPQTWALRATLAGHVLTLREPDGRVDEYERLK
jgi:hypothetical protein